MANTEVQAQFRRWARSYRAEAASDDYRLAVANWDQGCVSIEGERYPIQKWLVRELVRDTVAFVGLILAYYSTDHREGAEELLRLQMYDPARSEGRYFLIFERGKYRKTHLVVEELRQIDLVDLFEATCFSHLTILHGDGSEFETGEHAAVRQAVLDDVRHDYCEEEMGLEFNEYPTGLQVLFLDEP